MRLTRDAVVGMLVATVALATPRAAAPHTLKTVLAARDSGSTHRHSQASNPCYAPRGPCAVWHRSLRTAG